VDAKVIKEFITARILLKINEKIYKKLTVLYWVRKE